jgi:hypothetical protein
MIHSIKKLFGYNIRGTDGELGEVFDFYFDDAEWAVRYIIVDTGKWLPGRKVLLSPTAAGRPDWTNHALPVKLTKSQVMQSPPIDVAKPVDRQYEEMLSEYYGWPVYWLHYPGVPVMAGPAVGGGLGPAVEKSEREFRAEGIIAEGDPHLRSVRDVTGYRIGALDDEIGQVSDFIADTEDWKIRYMIVDTGKWLPGRKVLIAPGWIESVDWGERLVKVSMSKDQVKGSPEFEPTKAVNREYEAQLYDYYGRPKYW